MTLPTPAIVAQSAARPLPRWALLLLCIAYIIPGFVGRAPWKSADITAFGYMMELAQGRTSWLAPLLGGLPPETDGLLPYWIGAWAIAAAPPWLDPEMAVRLPFAAMLALTFSATWYGVYYLARSPGAQPVAFAFGGEAHPLDYARAIADGALLALIACLGLAQLSHEVTTYVVQLFCASLTFFSVAALPYRLAIPAAALALGLPGLVLAGAPAVALLLGLGAAGIIAWAPAKPHHGRGWPWLLGLLMLMLASSTMAWWFDLWGWRVVPPNSGGKEWGSLARLLLWFGWPAWPLAAWTLWRWRHQIVSRQTHRHLLLPLWFVMVSVIATITTQPADRALLLGLPAMAALAAFALPTLRRSMAALIDWFTLLFFSISALAIWVIWIAMQTGVPAKPAANVAKLAKGFEPEFSAIAFATALLASLAWCGLVWWRASRNRAPIWKSLVLPASGATLGWLLLMTLWLPLLDYARSYVPQMQAIAKTMQSGPAGCVQVLGMSRSQLVALRYHAGLMLVTAEPQAQCPWLLADLDAWNAAEPASVDAQVWGDAVVIPRPVDKDDHIIVLRRLSADR